MRQFSSPGSPTSLTPLALRSSNFCPLLVAGRQLPKSLPVSVAPEVKVSVYSQSVETAGVPAGLGKEQVQPACSTSRTSKVPGLMPVIS